MVVNFSYDHIKSFDSIRFFYYHQIKTVVYKLVKTKNGSEERNYFFYCFRIKLELADETKVW